MVGLMIIVITWLLSFVIGTFVLALYEVRVEDWDIHPLRLMVLLIPILNTIYCIYIIYKTIRVSNISELKLL
jgi:hypothetical protein